MKKIIFFVLLIMLAGALFACDFWPSEEQPIDQTPIDEQDIDPALDPDPDPDPNPDPDPDPEPIDLTDEAIEAMIQDMSLEEKISQMIMIACRSRNGVNLTTMTNDLAQLLHDYCFAGMILYAQNIVTNSQTYDLIEQIQEANLKANRPGLLISVDQEGGRVVRLEEGTTTPGNMALGAIGDLKITKEMASIIGEEIAALGFNTTFAPVVDVNNNPMNPVIGTRSFSDDPIIVSNHTAAYISGLNENAVIGCLKHFPGHGDTSTDSHTGLPLINKSLEELLDCELIPYINNIDDIEMFMTAHIVYPQIEQETYHSILNGQEINLPATLSKTILTDILRDQLGFNGVVITDAMEMDAINKHFAKADSARLAIAAGVDIILMPVDLATTNGLQDMRNYIANIAEQVNNGLISIDRINESVERILRLKANHGLLEGYIIPEKEGIEVVGSKEHHDLEFRETLKAITLVKNDGALPLTNTDRVLFITTSSSETTPVEYALSLAQATASVMNLSQINLNTFISLLNDYDKVVIFSQMDKHAYLTSATATKITSLINLINNQNKKAIVLSTNLPYDCAKFTEANAFVICYSPKGMSEDPRISDGNIKQYGPNIPTAIYLMYASAQDDLDFTGKLPVVIKQLDSTNHYLDVVLYDRGFGLKIDE